MDIFSALNRFHVIMNIDFFYVSVPKKNITATLISIILKLFAEWNGSVCERGKKEHNKNKLHVTCLRLYHKKTPRSPHFHFNFFMFVRKDWACWIFRPKKLCCICVSASEFVRACVQICVFIQIKIRSQD